MYVEWYWADQLTSASVLSSNNSIICQICDWRRPQCGQTDARRPDSLHQRGGRGQVSRGVDGDMVITVCVSGPPGITSYSWWGTAGRKWAWWCVSLPWTMWVSHCSSRVWPIVLLYNCCWYKLLYICLLIQTTEGPTERIGSHKCKVYSAFLPSFDGWYPVSGTTEDNWIETTMNKKTIQSLRSSIVLNYKVNIYHGNKCFPSCLVKLKISQMWNVR